MTQLRVQLREAAEREQRRGPVRRAAHDARWNGGSPPLLAAAAVVVLALLTVAAGMALRRDDPAPADRDLRVIANAPLVTQGGWMVAGFGSVWTVDEGTAQVVRVDPETRAIRARIDVGGRVVVNAGSDAVWATGAGRLLRIDPDTGRVTARIALNLPRTDPVHVIPGKRFMWVVTSFELRRFDPRREAFDRTVPLSRASFLANGIAYDADSIYVRRADGVLLTLDAATGKRMATLQPQYAGFPLAAAAGTVFVGIDNGVAAIDGSSGETLWTKNIGTRQVDGAVLTGTRVWVHGTDGLTGRDRLWRLDARSGAVEGSLTLPEFGLNGMAAVGGRIWMVTPGGKLLVVGDS